MFKVIEVNQNNYNDPSNVRSVHATIQEAYDARVKLIAYRGCPARDFDVVRDDSFSLFADDSGVIVFIQGKRVSTEEAVITFNQMSAQEKTRFNGMNEFQIIENIYSNEFDYFKKA